MSPWAAQDWYCEILLQQASAFSCAPALGLEPLRATLFSRPTSPARVSVWFSRDLGPANPIAVDLESLSFASDFGPPQWSTGQTLSSYPPAAPTLSHPLTPSLHLPEEDLSRDGRHFPSTSLQSSGAQESLGNQKDHW